MKIEIPIHTRDAFSGSYHFHSKSAIPYSYLSCFVVFSHDNKTSEKSLEKNKFHMSDFTFSKNGTYLQA